jgi:hypothetical protein
METRRLEERLGPDRLEDPSTTQVEAIFRHRTQFERFVEQLFEQSGTHRWMLLALLAAGVFVVWVTGFAIGGGFSSSDANPAGDVFIAEQVELLRLQSVDLQETRTRLAVAEGEAAFLRTQVTALSRDAERLQGSLNETELEMSIIVGVYEECLGRLYPAECIASARPAAESFLAEFYAETP